ncbi:MAG: DNA primase, partial [Halieaceae bacterium]|nr:DNA primase [Halieaceae bacterium]
KTPSFSVNPEKQFFYCFGCGAGGNAIGFVMDYERLEFPEAVENLAQSVGLEVPREESRPGERTAADSNKPLLETLEHAAQFYEYSLRHHAEAQRAISYLKQRGLSGEIAKRYRLGFAPPGWDNLLKTLGTDAAAQNRLTTTGMLVKNDKERVYDRFRDRIIFPIVDQRGRVIAFGGRVLGDDKPKYLNSPETPVFAKSRELYGLYQARHANRNLDRIVVVEGYMDVIALAQHGVTYAVATLGTATSETHLDRLYRMTPEVIFCFDGDEAGRKAAFRGLEAALPAMQDGRQARFLFLPEGEDPDTLIRSKGRDFFENLLDNAQPLEEFLFAHTAEGIDTDTTQGRTRWAKLTVPFLNRLPETGVYRDLMFRSLAERTGIEVSGLHRLAPVEPAPAEPSIPAESAPSYLASYSVPDAPTDYDDVPPPDYDQEPWPEDTDAPVLAPPNPLVYSPLNPVHRLIGLLVLRPTLANGLNPEQCPEGDRPDFALLKSLLEQIAAHSDISTAALLGYWYGTPEGEFLAELAGREILGENEELAELCQALWGKLQRENPLVNAKDRLSQLRKKDYASLGPDEKAELLKLTAEVRKLSGKA